MEKNVLVYFFLFKHQIVEFYYLWPNWSILCKKAANINHRNLTVRFFYLFGIYNQFLLIPYPNYELDENLILALVSLISEYKS